MTARRVRLSADERRAAILRAGVAELGERGVAGSTVDAIAAAVGVTQPYLFRLFGTKRSLVLAVIEHAFDLTTEFFAAEGPALVAGAADAREGLERLGAAYRAWVDPALLRVHLHAYAACADPQIRAAVTGAMRRSYRTVARVTGADEQQLGWFFGQGVVVNVLAVISPGAEDLTGWLADDV